METFLITFGIIIGAIIFLSLFIVIGGAFFVTKPIVFKSKTTIKLEKKNNQWFDYDKWQKFEYSVKSFDSYMLDCIYIKNNIKSNKYVIISHGFS